VRCDFAIKIDGKSLVFGILAGIVIGSITSVVLTKSLPSELTPSERYAVTMKIKSNYPWANYNGSYSTNSGLIPRYPKGATAVFLRNNVTIVNYQIWYSPPVNIMLQKGDYTVKIYDTKSGLYKETLSIYVANNIEIEIIS
jgi:hypothetical protein